MLSVQYFRSFIYPLSLLSKIVCSLCFQYARGVRQGCILSPLLFNLYINDLPYSFKNILSDPFDLPNDTKLSSLLYADDLIVLSRSKAGLQNRLNALAQYCRSWMLNINKKNGYDFSTTSKKI